MQTVSSIPKDLKKKLTGRDAGSEVATAILSGFSLLVVASAAVSATGWLAAGLWWVVAVYVVGFIARFCGWRTVSLSPTDQDWLKEHFK